MTTLFSHRLWKVMTFSSFF